jgi:electron transport complex protein RnfC
LLQAFSGGVHPQGIKFTMDFPSVRLDDFSSVEISYSSTSGRLCMFVRKGDHVLVGQLIGRADHPMSVPIHSSVSGEVTDVKFVVSATGAPIEAVLIQSDGKYTVDPP